MFERHIADLNLFESDVSWAGKLKLCQSKQKCLFSLANTSHHTLRNVE